MSDTSHDRAGEYQCVATVDAEGYVVSMSATRAKTADFYKALATLPRLPLDPTDIVLPAGSTLHPKTGRAVVATELHQHDGYYLKDLRTTYAPPNEEAA
jgi:hypothetical protein